MQISFSPQRRDDLLAVSKAGDVLTINGAMFDFSGLPDGGTLSASDVPCASLIGDIARIDGDLKVTLILPIGANPSRAVAFPAPIINPADGPVAIPQDIEEPANVDG